MSVQGVEIREEIGMRAHKTHKSLSGFGLLLSGRQEIIAGDTSSNLHFDRIMKARRPIRKLEMIQVRAGCGFRGKSNSIF